MTISLAQLRKVSEEFELKLAAVHNSAELESLSKEIFSPQSAITQAQKSMGSIPQEEKAVFGKELNQIKSRIKDALKHTKERIVARELEQKLAAEKVDVTVESQRNPVGAIHPITQLISTVEHIFLSMGWQVEEGPEIEAEYYNFDALNFALDHPARALQDTFYVAPAQSNIVMRTHTSPVQVRTMLRQDPPVYMICPGRVFRTDDLDATHSPIFTQVEGLAVDKHLTLAHLKGTLEYFAHQLFGTETKIRLRPHYFPFTEPSMEFDIWFENKQGGPGWIEWGGCGMVHPNVLQSAGINPDEYQGFAFGMGLERTIMFQNGIADVRNIVEGDVRFTEPFGLGW